MRLAVVGKGGAGKSVIAGTLARLLARHGETVLAVDSDPMPGLARSLGTDDEERPALLDAAERGPDGRWRLKPGVGPVRAVQRYARLAPDGVRLLQTGKLTESGQPAIQGAVNALYALVQRLGAAPGLAGWSFVGDLSAGVRQPAYAWASYARTFLLVVEPTWQSALTARRVAGFIHERGGETLIVANKVRGADDEARIAELLGAPVFAAVPADDAVRESDRAGGALLDHAPASGAVAAIEGLVDRLVRLHA